jgi:hypothetical protein
MPSISASTLSVLLKVLIACPTKKGQGSNEKQELSRSS